MISGPANFTLTLSPTQPIQTSLPEGIQVRTLNPSQFSSVFGSMESFRTRPHEGVDDPIPTGTPISFSIGGTFLDVGRTSSTSPSVFGGYGQFIKVRLSNGLVGLLSHLSKLPSWVKTGVPFSPGEIVGYSGGGVGQPGSGRSTGPHLHIEQHSSPGLGLEETTSGKVDPVKGGLVDVLRYGGYERGQLPISPTNTSPSVTPTPTTPVPSALDMFSGPVRSKLGNQADLLSLYTDYLDEGGVIPVSIPLPSSPGPSGHVSSGLGPHIQGPSKTQMYLVNSSQHLWSKLARN